MENHVLWEGMSYERSCLTGGHVIQYKYHEFRGVLHNDMSC